MKLVYDNQRGGLFHFDFESRKEFEEMTLSASAEKILNVPNAGGNSVISEVLSFEFFQKCFNAKLVKTEMEVSYFPEGGSITDYVCQIDGTKLGVSVTRAMKYFGEYTDEDAYHLLMKKLKGVNQATRNSMENWHKQILHVWVPNKDVANTIIKVYGTMVPDEVLSNTVVVVTRAHKSAFIFKNK
ncbi:hypothetical protein FSP39_004414 [Pinctada imbricata]|uniref:Uncharacterized protein n=1 Tax=Pinctada imbricata TaxID=66713 RepID=A0AA88Y354_PINIB|nr:hypothetical protein FSP39_004414 [Pinctada imbricata]